MIDVSKAQAVCMQCGGNVETYERNTTYERLWLNEVSMSDHPCRPDKTTIESDVVTVQPCGHTSGLRRYLPHARREDWKP